MAVEGLTKPAEIQWLSTDEAARRLGVKVDTLYAYVSRGLVASFPAPDGRSSRFDRADVEALLARRRSRPGGGPEPVIASRVTRLADDGVRYRGYRADALAQTHSFEEVAALLWGEPVGPASWPAADVAVAMPALPRDTPLADRLRVAIAAAAAFDHHRHDLRPESVVVSARRLIVSSVGALPSRASRPPLLVLGGRRLRGTVAGALALRLGAPRVDAALVRTVNTALVMLADNELATSTYAARLAASTRADVYSAVLAGAGCGGPLHTGASRDVALLLRDAAARGARVALGDLFRAGHRIPGFGHMIYRRDPRFAVLFDSVLEAGFPARRVALVREVLDLAGERVPVEPNVDFAGAALTFCAGMRADAGEALFLVARMAGWVAHVLEEYGEAPLRFRSRGLYVGEPAR